uniref:Uncharacterized protein n=1 Tax=Amphimedon queenslandica TaxID=400682 RepID=A0A1X7TES8_AMPQE
GKKFLACLISLIDEQKWNGYDYYTILENWMKIIFNLIDLSEESHKSQLFQWIHEGQINSSYFDYEYSFNKEYYKSGFNQVELRCLEEGSKAMTIILEGSPHLMARWKDFYVIFSSKDHTFETMKEFITHVKYLIKSGKDGSFRIDFLQPLTDMCLNASHKKKMASHFSVDANNVIKEGKEFLTCLILLIDEQKLNGHDYSTILENWMRIIFNLINLSEQLDESQLLQWIREGQINSSYFDYEYSFNKKLEDFLLRSQNLSAESLVSILSAVSNIRIRSKAQAKELKYHGYFCCGPSLEAIVTPWCPLIPQDAPPPHSVPYMQMHLMKESRSDTVDGIYQIYKDRDKLEVLFIIAREEQQQSFSPPDLRFRIIFISRRHKNDVMELAEKGSDLEVTVNITESKNEVIRAIMPPESKNYTTLIKVVHYVIQNRVTVSLSSGISEYPDICPKDKRVLSCFLGFLCYQSLENHIDVQLAVSSSVNCIFHLLDQPIHFDYMFPKDFIFYFDLAYTNYSNESVEKNAHLVMIHYLHELKKVPIETVAEQVEHFVNFGDFKAEMGGITNLSSVFEHTAKAFLKHCELYFKGGEISELFHVTLLLISIAVKINNFSDKKLAKKHDHIWIKRFNEYYKSGFNQNDLLCLEKGLKAMTTILEGFPHLMSEWKDFNFILSSKVHTFETM